MTHCHKVWKDVTEVDYRYDALKERHERVNRLYVRTYEPADSYGGKPKRSWKPTKWFLCDECGEIIHEDETSWYISDADLKKRGITCKRGY